MKPYGRPRRVRDGGKLDIIAPNEREPKKVLERVEAKTVIEQETEAGCNDCCYPGYHCNCCRKCGGPLETCDCDGKGEGT